MEFVDVGFWGMVVIIQWIVVFMVDFVWIWVCFVLLEIDDDGLIFIFDVVCCCGWFVGWECEFDYVEYCGECWEVYDVKYFFNWVFCCVWMDIMVVVFVYCVVYGGFIYDERVWKGQWDEFDNMYFFYMGWDFNYMMIVVQGVFEELGIVLEVFVKYFYIGNVM